MQAWEGRQSMKKLDRLSSIFWLILSTVICIHSYQLGLGRFHDPGPGFLFFWSGLVLGVLSLMILLPTIKRSDDALNENKNMFENVKWIKVLSILVSLMCYGFILEQLGFLFSTVIFIALLLRSMDNKKWYVIVFVSVVSSLLSYVLFEILLQSRLPKGIFGI